jgi:ABC-type uncharacterized transport system permease subunit
MADRLPGSFWVGTLVGLGLGLVVAAALVEWGLLSRERKALTSLAGVLLLAAGLALAYRAPEGE